MSVEEGRIELGLIHEAPIPTWDPHSSTHAHSHVILDSKPLLTPVVCLFNKQSSTGSYSVPGPVLDMERQEPLFVGDVGSDTNTRETIALRSRKRKEVGGALQRNRCLSWTLKDEWELTRCWVCGERMPGSGGAWYICRELWVNSLWLLYRGWVEN